MQLPSPSTFVVEELLKRIFPMTLPIAIEPVRSGVSTFVYRLQRGNDRFYLRILPELDARFTPEAEAHRLAVERGARVPQVIFVQDQNDLVQRSVMVTSAIPGQSISNSRLEMSALRSILFEAGMDLARINQVPVDGFGWIRRDVGAREGLQGEHTSESDFWFDDLRGVWPALDRLGLCDADLEAARTLARQPDGDSISHTAWLAQGDFDASHILQNGGYYSGIIDFGEIRGANRWYDLAHFHVHDGELIAGPMLPWLLEGYGRVSPLDEEWTRLIPRQALIIALRALARSINFHANAQRKYQAHLRAVIKRDIDTLGL